MHLLGLKLLKVIKLNLSVGCYLDKVLSEVAQIGGCASFRDKSLVSDTCALRLCSIETMAVFVLSITWLAIVSWIECSSTQITLCQFTGEVDESVSLYHKGLQIMEGCSKFADKEPTMEAVRSDLPELLNLLER